MAALSEYIDAGLGYVDELAQCLDEGDIDSARDLVPVLAFAFEAIAEAEEE